MQPFQCFSFAAVKPMYSLQSSAAGESSLHVTCSKCSSMGDAVLAHDAYCEVGVNSEVVGGIPLIHMLFG